MPEEIIRNYFNRQPFSDNKLSIFEHDCKNKGCELKGNFEDYIILNGDNIKRCLKINQKSVDRIIFTKKASNNKLDIILCELSGGKKRYTDVVKKVRYSGEYILKIFNEYGFKINDFVCIYLGNYKNENRLLITPFSIPGFHRNDIMINHARCGSDISEFV